MPPLYRELVNFINRLPPYECWRRLRIAVTQQELNEFREFIRTDGDGVNFVHAVCGVPLYVEDHPTNPLFILEDLRAQPSRSPIK